jgi:hypothetical protein
MQENGWACGGALTLKVALLARNRVISSVSCFIVGMYKPTSKLGKNNSEDNTPVRV